MRLFHKECGHYCSPLVVCSHCGTEIIPRQVHYRDVPGAGSNPREAHWTRCRRVSDPATLERVRPCSVARTLLILGDKWTFLILRDAFFGIRRYEELRARLGIATNILTDRLAAVDRARHTGEDALSGESGAVRISAYGKRQGFLWALYGHDALG